MRLFIAVQLNKEIRAALRDIQLELRRRGVRGNFTNTDNLHLTLAFIGEYDDPEYVTEALNSVPFAPFKLSLAGLGNFGSLWWIGVRDNSALTAYVNDLRHALADAGIPFDRKEFSPHVTLIRKAAGRIPEIIIPEVEMTADHISLMRSERGPNGIIYTEIGRN